MSCFSGTEVFLSECTTSGLPCRDGKCAGGGEACGAPSSQCEGSGTLAACMEGYRMRITCADLGAGFACAPSTATGARCQQGTQCDPDQSKGTEVCSGASVVICGGGKIVQVDCKALGFSGCSGGLCTP